jgi:hypothetical protein
MTKDHVEMRRVYLVWALFEHFPLLQCIFADRADAERWIDRHRNDSIVKYMIEEEDVL